MSTLDPIVLAEAEGRARAALEYRLTRAPVISRDEVAILTGYTKAGLDGWLRRNGVRALAHGRYARTAIEDALKREVRSGRRLPTRQPVAPTLPAEAAS